MCSVVVLVVVVLLVGQEPLGGGSACLSQCAGFAKYVTMDRSHILTRTCRAVVVVLAVVSS